MRSALDVPASAATVRGPMTPSGFRPALLLHCLDHRHQFGNIDFAVAEPGQDLAIVAAHLVIEIARDQRSSFGSSGLVSPGFNRQLRVDGTIFSFSALAFKCFQFNA